MPLVKRNDPSPTDAPVLQNAGSPLAALDSPDTEIRWPAARALAPEPIFVCPLTAALECETVPRVREAIMTALMRIGDEASVEADTALSSLAGCGSRTAAIEALQALPDAIAPFMASFSAIGFRCPHARDRIGAQHECLRHRHVLACAA